jgi:hypothetical protein
LKAWIAGLRRGQNESRAGVRKIEGIEGKLTQPLADWSAADVSDYIRKHDMPVRRRRLRVSAAHPAHTRSAARNERAGRWWWELDGEQGCGIHLAKEKRNGNSMLLSEVIRRAGLDAKFLGPQGFHALVHGTIRRRQRARSPPSSSNGCATPGAKVKCSMAI